MDKTISIVIPVYNEEKYLAACLDSIAAQTRQPDEVIVVDNNSLDETIRVAKLYPFVQLIKEKNKGVVYARNKGFSIAKSQLLARVDADSVLPPGWVENVLQLASRSKSASGITGRPNFYNVPAKSVFNHIQVLLYQRFQKLLTGSYILWGANMVITREAWQEVENACKLRPDIDEDISLSFSLREKGLKIVYSPELVIGASLQRGRLGLWYTMKYLSTWPRDYWAHQLYFRSFIIAMMVGFIVFIMSPFLMIHSLISSLRG